MKQLALFSISFLTKFAPKAWFSFHSLQVFPCTTVAVNDNRYFKLKCHNMMLLSFTWKTLPKYFSFELCLQFLFCFFVRLRPCYYISFIIALRKKLGVAARLPFHPPRYVKRLSFFHFANLLTLDYKGLKNYLHCRTDTHQ